jgi:hypothetical protein
MIFLYLQCHQSEMQQKEQSSKLISWNGICNDLCRTSSKYCGIGDMLDCPVLRCCMSGHQLIISSRATCLLGGRRHSEHCISNAAPENGFYTIDIDCLPFPMGMEALPKITHPGKIPTLRSSKTEAWEDPPF